MSDFPTSDSQYLANTVYPTLEIGLEELLKHYHPDPHEHKVLEPPIIWLANWLKEHNTSNTDQNRKQRWSNAVSKVQAEESDPISCCQNLVHAVKEVFWPIQACF